MNNQKPRMNIYTIAAVGLMAAAVFVASQIQIKIPTGIDNTRIHFGNIFCLLAGMLLGSWKGGLAAGIGSMLYDFTDPTHISSAPYTFAFKFAMAYICGVIVNLNGADAKRFAQNLIGAASGSMTYVVLYLGRSFIRDYYFLRNPLGTVITALITKGTVSVINGLVATAVVVAIIPAFRHAFIATGFKDKLTPKKAAQSST